MQRQEVDQFGFTIIPGVYNNSEIENLTGEIEASNGTNSTFRNRKG